MGAHMPTLSDIMGSDPATTAMAGSFCGDLGATRSMQHPMHSTKGMGGLPQFAGLVTAAGGVGRTHPSETQAHEGHSEEAGMSLPMHRNLNYDLRNLFESSARAPMYSIDASPQSRQVQQQHADAPGMALPMPSTGLFTIDTSPQSRKVQQHGNATGGGALLMPSTGLSAAPLGVPSAPAASMMGGVPAGMDADAMGVSLSMPSRGLGAASLGIPSAAAASMMGGVPAGMDMSNISNYESYELGRKAANAGR
jgi:hypothetical protein